jgi:dTDP-glucose 4,6-dehydratase
MLQQSLPLYGDGLNVRDWIHVDDHVHGIKLAFEKGRSGEIYNFGGDCERSNREIAMTIVQALQVPETLIRRVADRPGHDRRYAMDATKAKDELGFFPGPNIEERLPDIIHWYQDHRAWWEEIKQGNYRFYYERLYTQRLAAS